MEDIRSIYPGLEEPFYGPGDYSPILLSFDAEIVLAADDQDYQGDSYVLYRRGDSFGVLIFGWGSCSGCDALQACNTYKELDQLRNNLYDSIGWDTAKNIQKYFNEHDWEGDFSWSSKECKQWVADCKKYFKKLLK